MILRIATSSLENGGVHSSSLAPRKEWEAARVLNQTIRYFCRDVEQ